MDKKNKKIIRSFLPFSFEKQIRLTRELRYYDPGSFREELENIVLGKILIENKEGETDRFMI